MNKSMIAAAIGAFVMLAQPAQAQMSSQNMLAYPNEDSRKLADCIASSTTQSDRLLTARWMAAAMGTAAKLQGTVTVDEAAKEEADRGMAALFTRLFTDDCADQAQTLMAAGDMAGIQAAGGRLGLMAMEELMGDPEVLSSLMAYLAFVDFAAFARIAR